MTSTGKHLSDSFPVQIGLVTITSSCYTNFVQKAPKHKFHLVLECYWCNVKIKGRP
jgi:hypothetical protein